MCVWYYDDNNDGSRPSIFAVRLYYLFFHPAFRALIVTSCHRPTLRRLTPARGLSGKSVVAHDQSVFTVNVYIRIQQARFAYNANGTRCSVLHKIRCTEIRVRRVMYTERLLHVYARRIMYTIESYDRYLRGRYRILIKSEKLRSGTSVLFSNNKYMGLERADRSVYKRTHACHNICVEY